MKLHEKILNLQTSTTNADYAFGFQGGLDAAAELVAASGYDELLEACKLLLDARTGYGWDMDYLDRAARMADAAIAKAGAK